MTETQSLKTIRMNSIYGEIETFEDDLITEQIRRFGGHTRPEFSFALSALSPHMNVFDIGAHIGTFSMIAAKKMNPPAKLLAVEGNPRTFEVLRRNISNDSSHASTVCAFIGASDGMLYRELPGNTGGGRLVRAEAYAGEKPVSATDIDRLADEFFVPDYIKIDIEGAEFEALHDSKVISEQRPILYLEVSKGALGNYGRSPKDLEMLLKRAGYRFFVNRFERNGAHDVYRVGSISSLTDRSMFDVLCVNNNSDICFVLDRVSKAFSVRDFILAAGRSAKRRMRAIYG